MAIREKKRKFLLEMQFATGSCLLIQLFFYISFELLIQSHSNLQKIMKKKPQIYSLFPKILVKIHNKDFLTNYVRFYILNTYT